MISTVQPNQNRHRHIKELMYKGQEKHSESDSKRELGDSPGMKLKHRI